MHTSCITEIRYPLNGISSFPSCLSAGYTHTHTHTHHTMVSQIANSNCTSFSPTLRYEKIPNKLKLKIWQVKPPIINTRTPVTRRTIAF